MFVGALGEDMADIEKPRQIVHGRPGARKPTIFGLFLPVLAMLSQMCTYLAEMCPSV